MYLNATCWPKVFMKEKSDKIQITQANNITGIESCFIFFIADFYFIVYANFKKMITVFSFI